MPLLTMRSFVYSLAIHAAVIAVLMISFDSVKQRPAIKPEPTENVIQAVAVDNKAVETELQRLKALELQEQRERERQLKALEEKAKVAEDKRKKEQQRLADLKRKADRERKLAAEKKRKEEEARKKAEAEQKRAAEERKRLEQEKRKAAEQALKEQLEKEQQEMEAAQRRQDHTLLQSITAKTYAKVVSNFNKTGLPEGLECILSVQTIPGGEVIRVTMDKSSGNDIFDRRAIVAVEKASPLPLPVDVAIFDRLPLREFKFKFKPVD